MALPQCLVWPSPLVMGKCSGFVEVGAHRFIGKWAKVVIRDSFTSESQKYLIWLILLGGRTDGWTEGKLYFANHV